MSGREKFDARALQEILAGAHVIDARQHVRWLVEACELLEQHRDEPGAVFAAAGLRNWLEQGGDLVAQWWKLAPPRGSRKTASALYHEDCKARTHGDESLARSRFGTISPTTTKRGA